MRERERSLLRRSFYRLEELRFRRFEEHQWRTFAACVVTSRREEELVRLRAPGVETAVVANAVDLDFFQPSDSDPRPRTMVFNGVLDYRPNLDAALFLVEGILPRIRKRFPDTVLTVVGRGKPADLKRLEQQGVIATGEVPDIRPFVQSAAVEVVPIRMGGGTRFKVVEGLAMAKPIVSTTLGCEGIDVEHGRHLLVADTAAAFADAVVGLFDDPAAGRALGLAGRELVESRYSWSNAGVLLEELYGRLTTRPRAGSS